MSMQEYLQNSHSKALIHKSNKFGFALELIILGNR